jgi:hypothetical protein
MKKLLISVVFVLGSFAVNAQIPNDNNMTVQIDGKAYQTQPRRITIGNYGWITGNTISPDKSLRIWLGGIDGKEIIEPGNYLIIDEYRGDTPSNVVKMATEKKIKGVAFIRYVEETKTPRMEYHVGKSQNNGEVLEVKKVADGSIEISFSAKLAGSYWKEKASATVLGGLSRIKDKIEDKLVTKATGYDQDIDPEGRGYRKQDKIDEIALTEGKVKLKMQ